MATRCKHQPLNKATSLDKPIEHTGAGVNRKEITLLDVLTLPATDEAGRDPLAAFLAAAETAEMRALVNDLRSCGFSPLEERVFEQCVLRLVPYRTVAAELGVHYKAIDNASQRIMRKLRAPGRWRSDTVRHTAPGCGRCLGAAGNRDGGAVGARWRPNGLAIWRRGHSPAFLVQPPGAEEEHEVA
jgi:hypothetical protein